MDEIKEISYSGLQAFKDCPRKFYWRYIAELRPNVTSQYFIFGRAGHKGIETWFKEGPLEAFKAAEECYVKELTESLKLPTNQEEQFKLDVDLFRLRTILGGFFDKYADERQEEGDNELVFRIPLKSIGVDYIGAIDRDCPAKINEYKFLSSRYDFNLDKLMLDFQIRCYLLAKRAYGGKFINRVDYYVNLKDGLKPWKNEKIDVHKANSPSRKKYFGRILEFYNDEAFIKQTVFQDEANIDDTMEEIYWLIKQMRQALKAKFFYCNSSNCTSYSGCQYLPLCASQQVNREDTIRLGYHQEDPFSELKRSNNSVPEEV